MKLPKLVITDIDGVWTDGGMYYDNTDLELKKFNTSDSVGVLFLKYLNIPLVIMTGENSNCVKRRAIKLGIEHYYLGVKNKLKLAKEVCADFNVELSETAFIGDDINDMLLLKEVGHSACPDNAPDYIKSIVDLNLKKKGGDGAFREYIEYFVQTNNLLDFVLDKYHAEKNLSQ